MTPANIGFFHAPGFKYQIIKLPNNAVSKRNPMTERRRAYKMSAPIVTRTFRMSQSEKLTEAVLLFKVKNNSPEELKSIIIDTISRKEPSPSGIQKQYPPKASDKTMKNIGINISTFLESKASRLLTEVDRQA